MSTASKVWIAVIVLVIIGGVWWYVSASVRVATPASSIAPSGTVVSADTGLSTSPSDDSNAALDADMNSMNSQMNGLNTDTSDVNAGVASSSAQ